ncbi:serine protease FAM111A-like [Solea solea]|uniref:serine protease FAM111A-like n=1 Tax=Solea solea TaxID=90069 RepID=UPI00272DA60F|nr:serine protease FAM111A-like [Solea solea]
MDNSTSIETYGDKELLNPVRSVCKIKITILNRKDIEYWGTGFVFFDNFLLTNAHLFNDLKETDTVEIVTTFNYEHEPKTNYWKLCENVYLNKDLDFAILRLFPELSSVIPPGLLKRVGPLPEKGKACIIRHPHGDVKGFECIQIIEKDERINAIKLHLSQYNGTIKSEQELISQGIKKILPGGALAKECVTYNTVVMKHGSSGSPVFDEYGNLIGLHTGGYKHKCQDGSEQTAIAYAISLLYIIKSIVSVLREKNDEMLLANITEEAKGNQYLNNILYEELYLS